MRCDIGNEGTVIAGFAVNDRPGNVSLRYCLNGG